MTREEAESILSEAGSAGDSGFPLLEAAIACAEHDCPFRDPEPVRLLGQAAADRLVVAAVEQRGLALAQRLAGLGEAGRRGRGGDDPADVVAAEADGRHALHDQDGVQGLWIDVRQRRVHEVGARHVDRRAIDGDRDMVAAQAADRRQARKPAAALGRRSVSLADQRPEASSERHSHYYPAADLLGKMMVPVVIGLILMCRVPRLRFIAALFLVTFGIHSIMRVNGWFGSAGYPRYFSAFAPCLAIAGVAGWHWLSG